ncbi:MAG: winged helix-turn-helix domain-containing protein [Candidatus Bathyarchaeota archaeon]|nr:winged helix-turn-helix domain-containing protein [Candidatus Bathyarchaeota archaeon]
MAKLSGSKNIRSPKSRVKFDTKTVRMWVLPLLMRIDVGDYPTKAGRIIGLSRQHTWYYVRKLEECGLIRREKRSNVIFYELTSESKRLLASCEGTVFPGRLYRFDKCQIAYEIIADGLMPGNFKKIEMTNWTALLGTELGVKVRKTTRSWIVHVEVIRGRNPIEVTNLAMNLANRVRDALVSKYGCVLGDGKVIAGEMAVEDPVASLFGRYFTVRTDKRKIDHSWSVGELEHLQKDAVIEYLQMPEKVRNIEGEVAAMRSDISQLTSSLRQLFDAEGNRQPSSPRNAGGKDGYVA